MATSRLKSLQDFDPIITAAARGYSNNALISDKLMPIVTVQHEIGRVPIFGKEYFKLYKTERALRADSNTGPAEERSMLPYELVEHDFQLRVDYREERTAARSAMPQSLKAEYATRVMEVLKLRKEKVCADMVQNAANYPAGHVLTLAPADKFTSPTSDVVSIIQDMKSVVRSKTARYPNTLVLSTDSYEALLRHPLLIDYIKYAQVAVMDVEMLKRLFRIENIFIGEAVFTAEGQTFTDVWQKSAILAYVHQGSPTSERNPSFAYTLQLESYPAGDEYNSNGDKISNVRATDIYTQIVVGAESAALINETV